MRPTEDAPSVTSPAASTPAPGYHARGAEPLALGIDLGTGSARAFLYDSAGRQLGGVRLPYAWHITADGGVEADADLLLRRVEEAIDGALQAAPNAPAGTIAAAGISALWHTLLGVDADFAPVTPAYAWSDTRATGAARELRSRLDGAAVHARTGAMLHPAYPLARIAWIRRTQPETFRRVRWWISVPEYVWLRLTGRLAVGLSIAAGSGLLDQQKLEWDAELLNAVGIGPDCLAPLVLEEEHATVLAPGAAARWPALRGARWRLPVGDGACACIGSGCTGPSRMALTVGTSAAVRVLGTLAPGAAVPAGLWMYRIDRHHSLFGAASSNGGSVRQWLLRTLQLPAEPTLDTLLAARPPAAHGVSFLPFLAGERSPDWPLDASAIVAGLRLGSTPLDILQAAMEGVAYRLALLVGRLRAVVPEATTIVASGTALERSPYWSQLVADVVGERIQLCTEPEATCRGAALLGLVGAGVLGDVDEALAPGTVTIEPDARRHEMHMPAMRRLAALDAAGSDLRRDRP